ncbi:type VI secretion system baseplate subunit TssF [Enterovirga aerilata]|uniref:Type VI secretion system baseplate subunit TssF n=1 Tax=Enterovirga aerilata TaxID=2730920 RepID=A0A849IEI3_9HYPH|nr:type VI secretion system baseplate subunit TssF [Enterovirga sp. DB1703]NNM74635.1 type VI secretion system baseplate subunit TssF [Enterovirga sp. DB1703]
MNREFLDLYNRELKLLQEQAREFAEEYPGIAERLGGLVEDRSDPMIAGLLEGAAFLAARVQLKLKHEFPEFTSNLLEQLVPNYLAPTPSALLARVQPPYGDPGLREGRRIPRGAYLDATYRERERRVACRYRLATDITLWPFDITAAEYLGSPGPLQALGLSTGPEVASGLRLSLTHRAASRPEDEPTDNEAAKDPATRFAGCGLRELPVHVLAPESDAVAICEQIFADRVGVHLRFLDEFGDPVVLEAPADCVQPVGFAREEALIPNDGRIFEGFDLLREYFMFPRKFLAFRLTGLAPLIAQAKAKSIDVLFTFNEVNGRLLSAVQTPAFALYAAPAVNLFEMQLDRVPVRARQHEYHLIPDRSRYLDFELHRVLDVHAHYAGRPEKVPVQPLYSASGNGNGQAGLFYTIRRLPRRRSTRERTYGVTSDYTGTDMFLSLLEPAGIDTDPRVAELSIRALCSNRHLPEQLPVGEGGADFRLADDATLDVMCVSGPTLPREPIVAQIRSRTETVHTGAVTWRLINMLSLNHLGIVQRGAGAGARALREMLTLFADLTDSATERRIRGIRSVDSRAVVRRLRQRAGTGTARGTEIIVTLDEKAFEGTGPFLLGAILDRFFAEYASLNHFTQTVIRTVERGEIIRWPPRAGSRRLL